MRRITVALAVLFAVAGNAQASRGLLIPADKSVPPLQLVDQKVTVNIDDQVAVTRIEQAFRNHTSRQLEATYYFSVPKGASVRKFTMWVNGVEQPGEIVEANKARQIYTDIVRRTLDPGLLEYMDNNLIKLRVFPILPNADQKVSLSYTSVAASENGLIEYVFPMRAGTMTPAKPANFDISVTLKSQHPITNIYSPSHPITVGRHNDKEAVIGFEKNAAQVDRDFQLLYQTGARDIGLTAVTHRPNPDQPGYFMLLLSPRAELARTQKVPRDFVMVLDTSGSMRGQRIAQAKNALKYCLRNMTDIDRFTMIHFATTVTKYTENLQVATPQNIDAARRWVDDLEATGGTNIDDALKTALAMRENRDGRTFTVIFFTDGQPTVGEANPNKIIDNVRKSNTGDTRIFSFGVGDDVNTVLLDALADSTKAISTYVRESEDIEAKVSGLYSKISNPVMANLKLSVTEGVAFSEVYPLQLPDLFHGNQLVVFGRYNGKGRTAVKLNGNIGKETKEFVYELDFPARTVGDKSFVEDLWARRKVGYMLDLIRVNGASKELVDEVVILAKRYGIATPYTSYLLVPDGVAPLAPRLPPVSGAGGTGFGGYVPPALGGKGGGKGKGGGLGGAQKVDDFAKDLKKGAADGRALQDLDRLKEQAKGTGKEADMAKEALRQQEALAKAGTAFNKKQLLAVQQGKLGVDFAIHNNALRFQEQMTAKASQTVFNRNCIDVGGVWVDDGFDPKMETVVVKALSDAYFRILDRHPQIRDVYQLGNFAVWVTPSGKALVIDLNAGVEEMSDADIDRLFVAAKGK